MKTMLSSFVAFDVKIVNDVSRRVRNGLRS